MFRLRTIHRFTRIFLIAAVVAAAAPALHAQDAQALYKQGQRLKEAGETDAAIETFKDAIDQKYKFPDAHYELALCYMTKDHPGYRKKAEFAINHALEFDRDNIKYLSALAELRRLQGMFLESMQTCERILKIDPENVPAMENIAGFHYNRFQNTFYKITTNDTRLMLDKNLVGYQQGETAAEAYLRKIERDIELEEAASNDLIVKYKLELSDFALKAKKDALTWYDRILMMEPDNPDALFRMGVLHFDTGDLDGFIEIFSELLENGENEKNANLFLGLAYARKSDFDNANRHYAQALKLMDADERGVFENIDFIHAGFDLDNWKKEQKKSDFDTTGFWQKKDPLFMTGYNERRLEHYGRVAEANLRFSVPKDNIPGWKTDQGRIHIRYGTPDRKENYTTELPEFLSNALIRKDSVPYDMGAIFQKFNFWYYDDFTFVFNTMFFDHKGRYELQSWGGIDFDEVERKEFGEHPAYFRYKPKGVLFEFPVDVVSFRGSGGATDLKVISGVPLNYIRMSRERTAWSGTLQHGLFLFDEAWNSIDRQIDTTKLVFDASVFDTSSVQLYSMSSDLSLPSGSYNLGVELVDPASGNTGSFRRSFSISPYSARDLRMSGLLVAHRIRRLTNERPAARDNVAVIANPSHAFSRDQEIHLYFEVYNLTAGGGGCRYMLDYILYPAREKGISLRDLVWRGKRDEGISVSSTITAAGSDDNNIQIIRHNITKPGNYVLVVRISDLTTGAAVSKSTPVIIY